jgi:hypothetical protein
MKIIYPVKRNKSLNENINFILPLMFDKMMDFKHRVIGHPRLKNELHRMRITGKPMRYLMEILEPYLGKEFAICLHEIKKLIELMGEIHDNDVFISELREYLTEIRAFNKLKHHKHDKFITVGVINLILELRVKRNKDYETLCEILNSWEKENFKRKLINAMQVNKVNEINFFKSPYKKKDNYL